METEYDEKEAIAYIEKNKKMMLDKFATILLRESFGGNAGNTTWRGKSFTCGGVNIHINKDTGEINFIGNIQDKPKSNTQPTSTNIIFTVGFPWPLNIDGGNALPIIEWEQVPNYQTNDTTILSPMAQYVIQQTIENWNKQYE